MNNNSIESFNSFNNTNNKTIINASQINIIVSDDIESFKANAYIFIYTCSIIGIIYGCYLIHLINQTEIKPTKKQKKKSKVNKNKNDESISIDVNKEDKEDINSLCFNCNDNSDLSSELIEKNNITLSQDEIDLMYKVNKMISDGASVFLWNEYFIISIFAIIMMFLIFFITENSFGQFYVTIAFILGGLTSILSGFISMKIATGNNHRTTYKAM